MHFCGACQESLRITQKNAIINSRDIMWLKNMHKDWIKTEIKSFSEEEEVLVERKGLKSLKFPRT